MKRSRLKISPFFGLAPLLGLITLLAKPEAGVAQQHYESYFLYHGAYPENDEPIFSDNIQGLTHDKSNWFISQTEHLWKIPVEYDLGEQGVSATDPGVIHVQITDQPIGQLGYTHFGDLDYYDGYVLVPVGFQDTAPNGFLLFKGADLAYVGRAIFPSDVEDGGWVAVDTAGYVYSSSDQVTSIQKYSLDWDLVPNLAQGFTQTLTLERDIPLAYENGDPLRLAILAGGVFSPSGHLLYMVTGSMYDDWDEPNKGITVFDTQTWPWRRVMQSTNGYGHFCYNYNSGFPNYDEAEGITIWDMDKVANAHSSNRGQLHVLMLNNDADQDDATLYHYINTICVDSSYSGQETGEPHKPFNTVSEANNLAWNGARIKIQAGDYAEALTFSKQIQILAEGGTVRLGTGGQFSLTSSAAINLYGSSGLKLFAP